MTFIEELEKMKESEEKELKATPSYWGGLKIACLARSEAFGEAIEAYKNHSDWTPVSKQLPPMGESLCAKHKLSGHYHFCEFTRNYQWLTQYGETYEQDEMEAWRLFEPYEGE